MMKFIRPLLCLSFYLFGLYQVLSTYNFDTDTSSIFYECSFAPVLFFTLAYIIFIYVGKSVMSHKKPIDVKADMIVYNFYQIILNIICVLLVIYHIFYNSNNQNIILWGREDNPNNQNDFFICNCMDTLSK